MQRHTLPCTPAWLLASPLLIGLLAGTPETLADSPIHPPAVERKQPGIIEGVVTFQGTIPKSTIPDDSGTRRPLLEVNGETRGLRHAVLYLIPAAGSEMLTAKATKPAKKPAAIVDQQDHEFTPRVTAIHAGETIRFTNSDLANHNVRTVAKNRTNQFNVFTGVDGKYEHRFVADSPERPVRLACDIHPWMRGWIYIFDHAQFAVSDPRGRFRFGSVPPGCYTLAIRQPDLHYTGERTLTISAGQTNNVSINIENPKKD